RPQLLPMDELTPRLVTKSPRSGAEAGVVKEPLLGEHLKRPQIFGAQQDIGLAITKNAVPAGLLERRFAPAHAVPQLGGAEETEAQLRARKSDLMSLAQDFLEHRRPLPRNPLAGEKCRARVGSAQQLQSSHGTLLE